MKETNEYNLRMNQSVHAFTFQSGFIRITDLYTRSSQSRGQWALRGPRNLEKPAKAQTGHDENLCVSDSAGPEALRPGTECAGSRAPPAWRGSPPLPRPSAPLRAPSRAPSRAPAWPFPGGGSLRHVTRRAAPARRRWGPSGCTFVWLRPLGPRAPQRFGV